MGFRGGSGGLVKLYENTLGSSNQVLIDSGVNGIPPGFAAIIIKFVARTDHAAAITTSACGVEVNGDAGANYFYESLLDANAVYGGANNQATPDSQVLRANLPAATAGAGAIGVGTYEFYNYDNTNFTKCGFLTHVVFDPVTAANGRSRSTAAFWNNTAAINQLRLICRPASGGSFIANCRASIWGLR